MGSFVRRMSVWVLTLFFAREEVTCYVPFSIQQGWRQRRAQWNVIRPMYVTLEMVPKKAAASNAAVKNNTSAAVAQNKVPATNRTVAKNTTSTQDPSVKFAIRLQEMKGRAKRKETLSQSYCDSILAECVALDEWTNVLDVLDIMKQQGLTQERSTYRACLQACFERGNGASADEIFHAMRQALVQPNPIDISLVVVALCRQSTRERLPSLWKKAMTLLIATADDDDNKTDNEVVPVEAYDAVLSCMQGGSWKDAVRLLYLMEQGPHHPKPVLSTYRAVIETCVDAQQAEQAFQLLMSMPKKGLTPTVYTFELVISALAKKLQWRRALQLLDVMQDLQIPKTVVTYNTIILACARAGEVGAAKNLLVKMRKQDGVTPNIVSFNSVMTACASTSRWKDALSILDQCHREPGVQPDIITYTNAMRACARGRQTNRALSLLQVVKDKKLPIDNYCYTAVIDACAKAKMWRKALEILDEMERYGIVANEITYSVAITACGNGGQWERALALLDKMKEKNTRINLRTYNAAITALSKASRRNIRYSSKINAPRQSVQTNEAVDEDQLWVRALELIEQIKADGLEPDGFSYSAAISCCGAGGRWKEALNLIRTMQKGGPKTRPNKIAYTAAISACGRSGEYQHALQLFTDMKNEGLQPDRVSYNALFSALRVANMPDEAFEIWGEMCGKRPTNNAALATAKAPASIAPDIITVTDVIAALSRSDGGNVEKVDQVFEDAVARGIVLRSDSLDSNWEVDLTGMSIPVARAACRFIFRRIRTAIEKGEPAADVTLITGVGRAQRGPEKDNSASYGGRRSSRDAPERQQQSNRGSTALREYVLQDLKDDFSPPLHGVVPKRAQGTVVVDKNDVLKWAESQ